MQGSCSAPRKVQSQPARRWQRLWPAARLPAWWLMASLAVALVLLTLVLLVGGLLPPQPDFSGPVSAALTGSSLGLLSTVLGAVLVSALPRQRRGMSQRTLDDALSVSAGMMLAAAVFSLLEPARQQLASLPGGFSLLSGQLVLAVATLAGAGLMAQLERVLPHSHPVAGHNAAAQPFASATRRFAVKACSTANVGATLDAAEHINPRLWLFVAAIALHNVPEGLAVGIGFAGTDVQLGSSVSLAIALQDLPEGFAMALVLQKLGLPLRQVLLLSVLAALLEPVGAVVAAGVSQLLGSWLALSYPLLLALAAGAMLFVVVHEVMPEVQSAGGGTAAQRSDIARQRSSLALLGGFLLMWLLDSEAFLLFWRAQ